MVSSEFFKDLIEESLLGMHTAYVAKVLSVSGDKAKIQPLNMVKQYGNTAQKPPPVTAYILHNARYKLGTDTIKYASNVYNYSASYETKEVVTAKSLSAGDIVFCVCADRDITEASKGNMTTPPIGHHSLSDSVIVGVF